MRWVGSASADAFSQKRETRPLKRPLPERSLLRGRSAGPAVSPPFDPRTLEHQFFTLQIFALTACYACSRPPATRVAVGRVVAPRGRTSGAPGGGNEEARQH